MLLARIHPKWCHKPGNVQAALTEASTTAEELLPQGKGKITIHTSEIGSSSRLEADIWSDIWSDYSPAYQ